MYGLTLYYYPLMWSLPCMYHIHDIAQTCVIYEFPSTILSVCVKCSSFLFIDVFEINVDYEGNVLF